MLQFDLIDIDTAYSECASLPTNMETNKYMLQL